MSLRALLRLPLLHFLMLGALLYAADRLLPDRQARDPIVVEAADVERLRKDWARDTGRLPAPVELQASLRRFVEEEALLREAQRLGLDRSDAVVRARLLANMRFAFPAAGEDEARLLRQARALGMVERDMVVRRRLIAAVEQRIAGAARVAPAEIGGYLAQHAGRFTRAPRRTFRQVLFAPGQRRDARGDALGALQSARGGALPQGDPFLLGSRFDDASHADVARVFGEDFAAQLEQAPLHAWSGPLASPYGLHLVQVEQLQPARPDDSASARAQASYALLSEREREALRAGLRRLVRQHRVEMPPGIEVPL